MHLLRCVWGCTMSPRSLWPKFGCYTSNSHNSKQKIIIVLERFKNNEVVGKFYKFVNMHATVHETELPQATQVIYVINISLDVSLLGRHCRGSAVWCVWVRSCWRLSSQERMVLNFYNWTNDQVGCMWHQWSKLANAPTYFFSERAYRYAAYQNNQ